MNFLLFSSEQNSAFTKYWKYHYPLRFVTYILAWGFSFCSLTFTTFPLRPFIEIFKKSFSLRDEQYFLLILNSHLWSQFSKVLLPHMQKFIRNRCPKFLCTHVFFFWSIISLLFINFCSWWHRYVLLKGKLI